MKKYSIFATWANAHCKQGRFSYLGLRIASLIGFLCAGYAQFFGIEARDSVIAKECYVLIVCIASFFLLFVSGFIELIYVERESNDR